MTRLFLLLGVFLAGCDQPSYSGRISTSESACTAALELEAEIVLKRTDLAPDVLSFLIADEKYINANCARVELAKNAGLGQEYLVQKLAGSAVWTALLDADILARRGIAVDATNAASECIGLGILACDIVGWESVRIGATAL